MTTIYRQGGGPHHKKKPKKTIKQKTKIKDRGEAKKMIELLNLSLKHIHSDINMNVFNYINAVFDNLLFRYPTIFEFDESKGSRFQSRYYKTLNKQHRAIYS